MTDQSLIVVEKLPSADELFRPDGLESILQSIEAEARSIVPDVSTAKGRREIASMARRIASSKTYLDGLGKDYVAHLKALPRQVDAERRAMRDRLDAIKNDVRMPLTEWENAEKARVDEINARIAEIRSKMDGGDEVNSDEIRRRIAEIEGIDTKNGFDELADEANAAKMRTLFSLGKWLAGCVAAEKAAERVERERVERERVERKKREAQIAKDAADAAEREAKDAAERDRLRTENARLEAERKLAEAKRREAAAKEAESKAKREAEDRGRKMAEAAAAREREIADRKEKDRLRQEISNRQAEEKRASDKAHRASIHSAAMMALVKAGIPEDHAKAAVIAIAKGVIPAVSIVY